MLGTTPQLLVVALVADVAFLVATTMNPTFAATLGLAAASALLISPAVRRRAAHSLRGSTFMSSAQNAALTGILYRFKKPEWPAPLTAFESPIDHPHTRFCIYVGGLTDGLLACKYVDKLAGALDAQGWALVQPVLSSAYTGYGCSSLARDADELSELCSHLMAKSRVDALAIVGHSTGCQDAVTLLRVAPPEVRSKIRAAVLQAPVSDREADSLEPDPEGRAAAVAAAEALVRNGKGGTLLTDTLHNGFVPITASRYASLAGKGGPDDLFSSDLTDAELSQRLGHMGTRGQREGSSQAKGNDDEAWSVEPAPQHPGLKTCFAHSGGDEYVPPHVDVAKLSQRFVAAAGGPSQGAEAVILEGASHNCENAQEAFVGVVCRVLREAVR